SPKPTLPKFLDGATSAGQGISGVPTFPLLLQSESKPLNKIRQEFVRPTHRSSASCLIFPPRSRVSCCRPAPSSYVTPRANSAVEFPQAELFAWSGRNHP